MVSAEGWRQTRDGSEVKKEWEERNSRHKQEMSRKVAEVMQAGLQLCKERREEDDMGE